MLMSKTMNQLSSTVQQRSHHTVLTSRSNPRKSTESATSQLAHEYGLGLIIEGMANRHERGPDPTCFGEQNFIPHRAGPRLKLWTAMELHLERRTWHLKRPCLATGEAHLIGSFRTQAVVDGGGKKPQPELRCQPRHGDQHASGIGAAG